MDVVLNTEKREMCALAINRAGHKNIVIVDFLILVSFK